MIDEKLQEETWELLLEVMSIGEKHGINSDKLTPYHTRLLTLLTSRVEEAKLETTSTVKKWMVDYGKEEHDRFSNIEGVMIRRLSNMQDAIKYKLATLNNQSKESRDE